MWAVTSLWPQKVAFRSQNYSARAKLMLISDQARDLVKICFEARRPCFNNLSVKKLSKNYFYLITFSLVKHSVALLMEISSL